jgi:hypothetical protein
MSTNLQCYPLLCGIPLGFPYSNMNKRISLINLEYREYIILHIGLIAI